MTQNSQPASGSLQRLRLVSAGVDTTANPTAVDLQKSSDAQPTRWLRYAADRPRVAFVLAVFVARVALVVWASVEIAWAAALPCWLLGMFIAPLNHHHQHVNTFRSAPLNRLYELVLAVQTGVGPFAWVLHHNLGHHRNYLRQPPAEEADESRWARRDGSQMGRVEYTIHLVATHQLDIFRVGRRHPAILRQYLWMKLPLWALLGLGLWWNPVGTLLVFVAPAFLTLVHTAWATYEHHAGCSLDGHMEASRNRLHPVYNWLTGNLGYHTAHHQRPTLHWSLLPAHHERIAHKIPESQIFRNFW